MITCPCGSKEHSAVWIPPSIAGQGDLGMYVCPKAWNRSCLVTSILLVILVVFFIATTR